MQRAGTEVPPITAPGVGTRSKRRLSSVVLVALVLMGVSTVVSATTPAGNTMRSDVNTNDALVVFYDYSSAANAVWTTQADFTAGTIVDLDANAVPDSLVLAFGGGGSAAPWWNLSWTSRTCYAVDHTAAGTSDVTEYPVQIDLDTATPIAAGEMQPDGDDLRAIASDAATELPLWLEGPIDDPATSIWIQMDAIPAGGATSFCVYWGNPSAGSVSYAEAVFTYSSFKPLYYAVSGRYDTAGADIAVVSLVDGNRFTNGISTSPNRNAGMLFTFPAAENSSTTIISARGAVTTRGVGDGFDTLVPVSWAATSFVVPTERGTQEISIYAPFVDASVNLYDGTSLIPGSPVAVPAGTSVTVVADVTGLNSGIIESDVPVLVTHATSAGHDAVAVPPPSSEALYGIRSQNALLGFGDTTSGLIEFSDGSTQAFAGAPAGSRINIGGGAIQGGAAADGLRITADQPFAALQQSDGDGDESSMFLAESWLGNDYYLSTDSDYIAVVCPEPGTVVRIDAPRGPGVVDITCVGPPGGPAWAKITTDWDARTRVYSPGGEPFYAMYEDLSTNDETNLLGFEQGRQYTYPEPVITPGGGGYVPIGTWESPTYDTGGAGVYGTISWLGSLPAGTSIRFQVATDNLDPPVLFVGPDGTPLSWFTSSPTELAFIHDGERYLRVRAELASTDPAATPQLDEIIVGTNLIPFNHMVGVADTITVSGTAGSTSRHYLARVKTAAPLLAGSTATMELTGSLGLPNISLADVSLGSSLQVSIVGGVVVQPIGPPVAFDAAFPHSIILDEQMAAPGLGAALDLHWQANVAALGSPLVEHDLEVVILP
jgi:hypothetical protein